MPVRRRTTPITGRLLHDVSREVAAGRGLGEVCRRHGIDRSVYWRWRQRMESLAAPRKVFGEAADLRVRKAAIMFATSARRTNEILQHTHVGNTRWHIKKAGVPHLPSYLLAALQRGYLSNKQRVALCYADWDGLSTHPLLVERWRLWSEGFRYQDDECEVANDNA